MLSYQPKLKRSARALRAQMTDAEQRLWYRLRRKQLLGVQFYRQKPLGDYIVDFYAPKVSLVVEVDGAQHLEADHSEHDRQRSAFLEALGLQVLRFDNGQVLRELDRVVELIFKEVQKGLGNPP